MELSSKNHAVQAIEVHYQLHSTPLKYLIRSHYHTSPHQDEGKRGEGEGGCDEVVIRDALLQLKDLPLSHSSYPVLWKWAVNIFKETSNSDKASEHMDVVARASEHMDVMARASEHMDVVARASEHMDVVARASEHMDVVARASEHMDVVARASEHMDVVARASEHIDVVARASEHMDVVSDVAQANENMVSNVAQDMDVASEVARTSEHMENSVRKSCDNVCSGSSVAKVSHDSTSSLSKYMQLCFYGVSVCAVRCPAYYKPLYRMASTLQALGLPQVSHLDITHTQIDILVYF